MNQGKLKSPQLVPELVYEAPQTYRAHLGWLPTILCEVDALP